MLCGSSTAPRTVSSILSSTKRFTDTRIKSKVKQGSKVLTENTQDKPRTPLTVPHPLGWPLHLNN